MVKSLIEHGVPVDIYGACGNLTCGNRFDNKTDAQDETCRKMASENYKFYIAFENSLCLDYVTEKYEYFYLIGLLTSLFDKLVLST